MPNTVQIARFVVVAAALLPLGAAHAVTTYRSTLLWGAQSSTMTGSVVTTATGGAYTMSDMTFYSMSTSGSPANNGTAEARFTADVGAVSVSTEIAYTLNLVGPQNALVPVRVTANGLAEGDGYAACCGIEPYSASVSFNAFSAEQGYLVFESASVYPGFTTKTLAYDQTVFVQANTDIFVSLSASAKTIASFTHTTTIAGHAFIDPQFTVDPAYASEYAFVGLPTAAVPEPATGALFALGGGVIAIASRCRCRRSPAHRAGPG